jgi:prepilin-type N-terminal cleavage/methylation domain-containing protein
MSHPCLHNCRRTGQRRGFTLVELLVVIAVLGVLIAILLPSLSGGRSAARRAVCMSNLHQLGVATLFYLDANDGHFWRYYTDQTDPPGRRWWFGFEPNGPGAGTNRPLDKSQSPLGPYTANLANLLQCPDFPYGDSDYFPKFDQHAASYGYNIQFLGPVAGSTATRWTFDRRASEVFVFADGVQFDFGTTFNEGHYMVYTAGAKSPSGYAHFRHPVGNSFVAQVLYIDGHTESQAAAAPNFRTAAGMPTGNLRSADGANAIYGFAPP